MDSAMQTVKRDKSHKKNQNGDAEASAENVIPDDAHRESKYKFPYIGAI